MKAFIFSLALLCAFSYSCSAAEIPDTYADKISSVNFYPGGAKFATAGEWMKKFPERVIEHAVKGMLPKNKLGADLFRKLHVYAGDKHPHAAQQPEEIKIEPRH